MAKRWERLPEESPESFRAFQIYRDLGYGRTLLKVQETVALILERGTDGVYRLSPTAEPPTLIFRNVNESNGEATREQKKWVSGTIARWSSQYDWRERAAAFDEEVDRRIGEKKLDALSKMKARHVSQAAAASAVVSYAQAQFLTKLQDPEQVKRLGRIAIEEWLQLAIESIPALAQAHKAERLANGVLVKKGEQGEAGPYIWTSDVRQPERKEAPAELEAAEEQDDPWLPDGFVEEKDDE